jgi:hypothetical protein
MALPSVSPCPYDGYANPIIEPNGTANDGTQSWHVICPICRIQTPQMASANAAAGTWNVRPSTNYTIRAWDPAVTTYAKGSLVSDAGLLYGGLAPVTGSHPSAAVVGEWMLLAN